MKCNLFRLLFCIIIFSGYADSQSLRITDKQITESREVFGKSIHWKLFDKNNFDFSRKTQTGMSGLPDFLKFSGSNNNIYSVSKGDINKTSSDVLPIAASVIIALYLFNPIIIYENDKVS